MTRNDIEALFERRKAAFGRQDAKALARDYAEECVVESPSGGVHHGRDAAQKVLQTVFSALDARLSEEKLIIDGDSVAQVVTIEGKDVGALLGMTPTGKPFRVPGVFLYELQDGRIVKERRIYDFTSLLIQTGLMKAKPAT